MCGSWVIYPQVLRQCRRRAAHEPITHELQVGVEHSTRRGQIQRFHRAFQRTNIGINSFHRLTSVEGTGPGLIPAGWLSNKCSAGAVSYIGNALLCRLPANQPNPRVSYWLPACPSTLPVPLFPLPVTEFCKAQMILFVRDNFLVAIAFLIVTIPITVTIIPAARSTTIIPSSVLALRTQ